MRGVGYWLLQYLLAAASMFAILIVIDLVGGKKLGDNVWMSLAFALGMAAVFVLSRYQRWRSGKR